MQGRLEDAEREGERALEILESSRLAATADRAGCSLGKFADLNQRRGNPTLAVELYRKAIEAMQDPSEAATPMARLVEVPPQPGASTPSPCDFFALRFRRLRCGARLTRNRRAVRTKYDEVLKESARTMLVAE